MVQESAGFGGAPIYRIAGVDQDDVGSDADQIRGSGETLRAFGLALAALLENHRQVGTRQLLVGQYSRAEHRALAEESRVREMLAHERMELAPRQFAHDAQARVGVEHDALLTVGAEGDRLAVLARHQPGRPGDEHVQVGRVAVDVEGRHGGVVAAVGKLGLQGRLDQCAALVALCSVECSVGMMSFSLRPSVSSALQP